MPYRSVAAAVMLAAAAFAFSPTGLALAADAPAAAKPATPATPATGAPAGMSPQGAFLVANLKKPGWKATPSGLQYHVIKSVPANSGPKPAPGSIVTVHYEGTFIDGTKFDSSYDRQEPTTFPLANVIPGWQEGVPMMREGETWEFALPADLGYGARQSGPIPGGSTLLFKVRLFWAATPAEEVKPAAKPAAAAPAKPAAK